MPISQCLIVRAARNEGTARDTLFKVMKYNMKSGHFTMNPCRHDPECVATKEELDSLDEWIAEQWKATPK